MLTEEQRQKIITCFEDEEDVASLREVVGSFTVVFGTAVYKIDITRQLRGSPTSKYDADWYIVDPETGQVRRAIGKMARGETIEEVITNVAVFFPEVRRVNEKGTSDRSE